MTPPPAAYSRRSAGLYFHIPFCRHKCDYCDFYSVTDLGRIPEVMAGLAREIAMRSDRSLTVDTVYIGGGTPSILPPEAVDALIADVAAHFRLAPDLECTLEVNPGTVGPAQLAALRRAGVNRLTLGVQSFSDRALKTLGRIHTSADAVRVVGEARAAGFDNIGLDLIYGIPGQGESQWQEELEKAVALGPEHLSCYMLTYETGTPLERACREGEVESLADAYLARLYEVTLDILAKAGFIHYEISNFAASLAHVSRHNMKYWTLAPYLGFGPSAHSYRDFVRSWNAADVDRYLACLVDGRLPQAGSEVLSREQQMIEAVYLGLRMTAGIDIVDFEKRFSVVFSETFEPVLTALESEEMIDCAGGRCRLSRMGLSYADAVTRRLVEAI